MEKSERWYYKPQSRERLDLLISAQRLEMIMSRKKSIMLGMVVFSVLGGYLPALFGQDDLMVSLLGSFIGGMVGIWIGYKFSW